MCCRISYTWHHDFPKLAKEAGFCFNDPSLPGNFDWSSIGSLDVDRMYRERDFASLEYSLRYILEGPLGNLLNSHVLDPSVAKLFKVSQLAVQYLLFCKQFLDRSVTVMRDSLLEHQKQIVELKASVRKKDEQIFKLRQKYNRSTLDAFTSGIGNNTLQATPSCHVCSKTFLNVVYLQAHLQRRHPEEQPVRDTGTKTSLGEITARLPHNVDLKPNEPQTSTTRVCGLSDEKLIDNVKLQLEIKQLKDRLSAAEKHHDQTDVHRIDDVIERTGDRTHHELTSSRKDVAVNTNQEAEQLKAIEDEQLRKEIADLKDQFNKSIESLKNQSIWMEVSRKLDSQETLWKTRCEALETKLDEDTARLMRALNDIGTANVSGRKREEAVQAVSVEVAPETENVPLNTSKHEPKIRSGIRRPPIVIKNVKSTIEIERKPPLLSTTKKIPISNSVEQRTTKYSPIVLSPRVIVNKTENEVIDVRQRPSENNKLIELESRDDDEDLEKESDYSEESGQEPDQNPADRNAMDKLEYSSRESLLDKDDRNIATSQQRLTGSLRELPPVELQKCRNSVVNELDERLWKLNIDPSAKGLLDVNFQNAMRCITHQRKLKNKQALKRGINLESIRSNIEKNLEKILIQRGIRKEVSGKNKSNNGKLALARHGHQTGGMRRVRSAMAAFRTKSMEILPNLLKKHDVKKSPTKFDSDDFTNRLDDHDGARSIQRHTSSPISGRPTSAHRTKIQNTQNTTARKELLMYDSDSVTSCDESMDDFKMNIAKPAASTSLEQLLASPIKKPEPYDFTNARYGSFSPPAASDQADLNEQDSAAQRQVKGSSEIHHQQSVYAGSPSKNKENISAFDDVQEQDPIQKLSDRGSSDTESPSKTRPDRNATDRKTAEIFDRPSTSQQSMYVAAASDESDLLAETLNDRDRHRPEDAAPRGLSEEEAEAIMVTKSNFRRNVDQAVAGAEKKRVVFDLDANTHKTLSSQDDDLSDYDLSSIVSDFNAGELAASCQRYNPVMLSTRQSPKIAEIAKEIQGQLRALPRMPVGGIIAGIASPRVDDTIGGDQADGDKSNAPVPKPRNKPSPSPNILDDLTLSDFSF